MDNLQDRLDALKKKYLENEINVQKAEREADSATSLANRAEAVRYTPAHKVTINQFGRGRGVTILWVPFTTSKRYKGLLFIKRMHSSRMRTARFSTVMGRGGVSVTEVPRQKPPGQKLS